MYLYICILDLSFIRCGHCKQFVPEYEKIAQALKENDPPIPVAKVDATSASDVASRFDVSGYPTIKIMKKGEPVDYDGERTEKGKEISFTENSGCPLRSNLTSFLMRIGNVMNACWLQLLLPR